MNRPSKPLLFGLQSLPPPRKSTIDHVLPELERLNLDVPQEDGLGSCPQIQSLDSNKRYNLFFIVATTVNTCNKRQSTLLSFLSKLSWHAVETFFWFLTHTKQILFKSVHYNKRPWRLRHQKLLHDVPVLLPEAVWHGLQSTADFATSRLTSNKINGDWMPKHQTNCCCTYIQ